MRFSFVAAGCVSAMMAAMAAHADVPVLKILTYESFAAEWGPGPAVEKAFEAGCACDLQWVSAVDGAALLARVKLEGAGAGLDLVLGLDTSLVAEAADTGLFAPHPAVAAAELPTDFVDPIFVPYDWGWFAFVYDKTKLPVPPKNFPELAASALKIAIQDPRSSTPGLGLLLWIKQAYGDKAADIWAGLADNILTVTPGWTESYGLFLSGEADMVLSYTTSPAYHLIAEQDATKAAALFDEGHYLQIEVAGKLAAAPQPALADQFLAFMLTEGFQGQIATTNWMYPAITPAGGLPEGFGTLIAPGKSLLMAPDAARAARNAAVDEWLAALAR